MLSLYPIQFTPFHFKFNQCVDKLVSKEKGRTKLFYDHQYEEAKKYLVKPGDINNRSLASRYIIGCVVYGCRLKGKNLHVKDGIIREKGGNKRIVLRVSDLFVALITIPRCLALSKDAMYEAARCRYTNLPRKIVDLFFDTKESTLTTDPMQLIKDLRNYFPDSDMYDVFVCFH
jgi:hypothetical protein